MNKKGRSKDIAYLKTAQLSEQPFSIRRLVKDFLQIQQERVPTVGVVAKPLDNNIYVWHANIRGPQETIYAGGVFHLQIQFPVTYPHAPPVIKILTPFKHPNVFGETLCIDFLNGNRSKGTGWSSAYSIQSVLIQLQSFLFEQNLDKDQPEFIKEVKKAINNANDFKCQNKFCKHGGRLACWPPFSSRENQIQNFYQISSQQQIFEKELICYHTKSSYLQNQLGIGLRITKVPRTGQLKEAELYPFYISAKSFIRQFVRWTPLNERFSHWLPLYFGLKDSKERFMKFLKGAVSMIVTGNAQSFKPQYILQLYPKIIITLVYRIMDEKSHPSINIIRFLSLVHSNFLMLIQEFPSLQETISKTIELFKSDQKVRHKDITTNLGAFLALFYVAKQNLQDIKQLYLTQQLQRQVFWLSRDFPQLIQSLEKDKIFSEDQINVSFKLQVTSFQIFCFQKYFISKFAADKKAALEIYKKSHYTLPQGQLYEIQREIKMIYSKIVSYKEYNAYVGIKQKTVQQYNKTLKDAFKKSAQKGYHGQVEQMNKLVSTKEQCERNFSKLVGVQNFFNIKQEGKDKKVVYHIQSKKVTDQEFKTACCNRWSWIRVKVKTSEISANEAFNELVQFCTLAAGKKEDRLTKIINQEFEQKKKEQVEKPSISWKQFFAIYDFVEHLMYLNFSNDFKGFYRKLNVLKEIKVNSLIIPHFKAQKLKSDYHVVTVTLQSLPHLRRVEVVGDFNLVNLKFIKCLSKGFNNFVESKGSLQFLAFNNIKITSRDQDSDLLIQIIAGHSKLKSLKFINTNFLSLHKAMKKLCSVLDRQRTLQEIVFIKITFTEPDCILLADALMRIKPLKVFRMRESSKLGKGLASISYSLAFSPAISILDFSQSTLTDAEINQLVISLKKLLTMTTSLKQLSFANSSKNVNPNLKNDFWMAIGNNFSLCALDISNCGTISQPANVGKGIAFNAKRNGVLSQLKLNAGINFNLLKELVGGLYVSKHMEEMSYGDQSKANKMTGQDFQKKFYCNLKVLEISKSYLFSNFQLAQWNKRFKKETPELVKLIAHSKISKINFQGCAFAKGDSQLLALALDPTRNDFISKLNTLNLRNNRICLKALQNVLSANKTLQYLDLSKNKLGVSGSIQLADILKKNSSIKFLNIFNNMISFDGAKALSKALEVNSSLNFIEIGHNRIRDKGFTLIVNSILNNKNSSVKSIATRFNFLSLKGLQQSLQILNKSKVKEVFIRNNNLNESGVYALEQFVADKKIALNIDVFDQLRYVGNNQRTVWIFPVASSLVNYKNLFESLDCGVVTDMRVRKGFKYPGKPLQNIYGFVEFAHPDSVKRALTAAAKKQTMVDRKFFKVYKAGSGTFMYTKKSQKQVARENECKIGVQERRRK